MMAWQGGIEGGLAAAELLMGQGNPSGKLSDTFARDLTDYPSSANFFESDDYIDYTDDIYVGYRYFETIPGAAGKVVYPFGYGLSYTTFSIEQQEVQVKGDEVTASALVRNTGKVPGREVVQIYYGAPQGLLGKPAKELAGYQKTKLLEPGDQQYVFVHFSVNDMASYDDLGKVQKSAYVLEKGEYKFYIGTSVRDTIKADCELVLKENRIVRQLKPRMVPTSLEKRMLPDGSYEMLPQSDANDPNESVLERMKEQDMEFPMPAVRSVPRRQYYEERQEKQLAMVETGEITINEFIAQLSLEDLAWLP